MSPPQSGTIPPRHPVTQRAGVTQGHIQSSPEQSVTSPPNLEGWDGPSGDSHANPSPHIPALLEQEDLGLGDSWSRCCRGGGVHWANKGSRVCLPIRSGDRGSLSPFPGDYWVLGISRVSWPRGTESQLSSSKEGRERAWEVTECPEMRSPSPTTSPSHLLHPYWLGSQTASFPPEAPKDKGCRSWTLRLP